MKLRSILTDSKSSGFLWRKVLQQVPWSVGVVRLHFCPVGTGPLLTGRSVSLGVRGDKWPWLVSTNS